MVLQDLKYTARSLARTPGFTTAALLTLALGIGANTAIFSVLNAVVLRPLPYADPERIVGVWNSWDDTPRATISPAEYFDYLDRVKEFEHFGVFRGDVFTLTGSGEPYRVRVGVISHGVLPALGTSPASGRIFTAEEDIPGRNDVVLLSDALWRGRFGSNPDVVGTRIVLDNRAHTIVGVMPRDFRLPQDFDVLQPAQVFVPLGLDRGTVPNRGFHFLRGVARVRAGVSQARAASSIAGVAAQFTADFPSNYASIHFSATVTSLRDDVIGDARPTLLVLLGAIGFVLLIACANITSLFLSRNERRQREFALRAAIGASRADFIRQSLVESGLVALAGGALGVLVAMSGTRALMALKPPNLPRMDSVPLDLTVLGFTLALSISVGVIIGLIPALRSATSVQSLPGNARGVLGSLKQQRLRRTLVTAEVALAIALLFGAGLLARSFARLVSVDPGFQGDQVLTALVSIPPDVYRDKARVSTFFSSALDRLRAQPGVVSAGAVGGLPLTGTRGDLGIQIEGRETPVGQRSRRAAWQVVTPGYFETIGMRVLRGRGIEREDLATSPGVVVLNEAAARLHWPNADPIGTRLKLSRNSRDWLVVVGIVNDVRQSSLRTEAEPELYLAHSQFDFFGGPVRDLTIALRSTNDAAAIADTLRREVAAVDPGVPVDTVQTMQQVRSASVGTLRFVLLLLSTFASVALAVALVGVYGVVAYAVHGRKREIGVRVALGANPARVIGLVSRQGISPAIAGIVIGLAVGVALSRFLRTQLYQVAPGDPVTLAIVSSLVALVALAACYIPSRRAARLNPVDALRAD